MFHFEVTDEAVPDTPRTASGDTIVDTDFSVGDKIHDPEKYTGVVKYVGIVGKHPGIWLGIEWDDPSRGKHSGSMDGREYFQCSLPNAGSFVRSHKAKSVRHLKEALEVRYGHDESAMTSVKSIEDRLERKKLSYSQLRTLNLSSKGILDSPNDIQDLNNLCPNIEALELADNLIRSWNFVGKLCSGFAKLSRIDFSKNPFNEVSEEELREQMDSFQLINHAVLGGVGYGWQSILKLSTLWPKLTNLQVPFNFIETFSPPTVTLMNVTTLDLEGNKIQCWNEVLKLTVLQRLEYLNLCGNTLKAIRFPAETDQVHTVHTSLFPNLIKLNLAENSIDDWISISELNKLRSLEELRVDLNPLMNKDTKATNRQLIIARIGKLKKLEGVEIVRQERRDSEIDYVKRYVDQWEAEKDSFRFASENPRYAELVEKWGQSESGEATTAVKTMKSSLINVTFVSQIQSHKPCSKKVIPTMNVQKLKGLIQRVFRETNPPVKITAVSSRNPGIMFHLEDDFTDLATYSIEEGDKLLIAW